MSSPFLLHANAIAAAIEEFGPEKFFEWYAANHSESATFFLKSEAVAKSELVDIANRLDDAVAEDDSYAAAEASVDLDHLLGIER